MGRHIEHRLVGVGHVLTADQVLHDGDVVSRSDGFGTTARRTPVTVSHTMNINFLDESVKAASGPPLIRRRELHDFS